MNEPLDPPDRDREVEEELHIKKAAEICHCWPNKPCHGALYEGVCETIVETE